MNGKKQILSRAKELKEVEECKRMFISPDLTRKEQTADKVLRTKLTTIKATEATAKIKYGIKIVKNKMGTEGDGHGAARSGTAELAR